MIEVHILVLLIFWSKAIVKHGMRRLGDVIMQRLTKSSSEQLLVAGNNTRIVHGTPFNF